VRKRQWLSEHPSGTMKRAFNQGYMLKASSVKVKGKYYMRRLMDYLNIIKHVYVITFHTV